MVFSFFLGVAVGSFLNVLIDRLPREESIIYPPSHCDFCKRKLAWYDLIPVVSFLLLQGRCRYCGKPFSWQYPIVELLTGILFVSLLPFNLYHLFILSSLIVVFFADLKYGIIPDKVVFPAIGVSFIVLVSQYPNILISHLLSAFGAFLFFLLIYLATQGRGIGFGDVKLAGLLGIFLGFPNIVFVVYLAFLTGAIFSIILILLGKKKLKETIAFGPFLVAASFVVFFFQDKLAQIWYLPEVFL